MADTLTLKQQRFAQEYVKRNGNGTRAAEAAGYSGNDNVHAVKASNLVRNGKVKRAIQKLTLRHEISPARVLARLDNLSVTAEAEGQYGVSAKCEELLGKSLGMWIDQKMHLNVDVSGEHLAALMEMAKARRTARAGASQPLVVDAEALDVTPHSDTEGDQ
jgi:hypothetical protein